MSLEKVRALPLVDDAARCDMGLVVESGGAQMLFAPVPNQTPEECAVQYFTWLDAEADRLLSGCLPRYKKPRSG